MQVTLADGTDMDLATLDRPALCALQFEQEKAFAQQIKQSPKGSQVRQEAIRQGYDTVCSILHATQEDGEAVQMGFDPRYLELVLELLAKRQVLRSGPAAFFEIGYGSGSMIARVARQGYDVAGIEVSPAVRVQALKQMPAATHERLLLGNLLAHDLTEWNGTFDVVYWNDVLEHLPTDETADFLAKAYALLRRGGMLVTISPNWHERPSDVTGDFCPPRTEACGLHLKEYTLREVTSMLHAAGFAEVETPCVILPHKIYRGLGGLASVKRICEPTLEWMPFKLARTLVHGFGLSCTIAHKK